MRNGDAETVGFVVDPQFGARLREIATRGHVWIIDSQRNRPVVEAMWSTLPKDATSPVTIFDAVPTESPSDTVVRMVDTVDLHHPQCTCLEFYGVAANPSIKSALASLGYSEVQTSSNGFIAKKHAL